MKSSPAIFAKTLGTRKASILNRTYASPRAAGRYIIHYSSTASDKDAVPAYDVESLTSSGWSPGGDGISDYVQWAAAALDSSIPYITQTLGYSFNGALLHVYMHDLINVYGYAIPGTDSLELDNDMSFLDLFTGPVTRRQGYAVTVAHEFFHRVQFGYTVNINFFNEPSAAWMEDEVFPDINDYIQYVESPSSLLNEPEVPLDGAGITDYDRLVWAKFLDERYGSVVIRRAWQNYGSGINSTREVFTRAIQYVDPAVTFPEAFAEFGQWMFYTGARSAYTGTTFEDAALWPAVRTDTVDFNDFLLGKTDTLLQLSLYYALLRGRNGREAGFTVPANIDSLGLYSASLRQLPATLISESRKVTQSAIVFLDGWSAAAGFSEYFALSNPNASQKRVEYLTSDSLYVFAPGDTIRKDMGYGFSLVKVFHDSVVCRLKDTTGQPDTAGRALFSLLYAAGASIALNFSVQAPANHTFSKSYRVVVEHVLDSLFQSGVLDVRFELNDTTGFSRFYALIAFDSTGRFVAPFEWTGTTRALSFSRAPVRSDAAGKKVFFIGYSDAFSVRAFPNPVYADHHLFSVVDNSQSATALCRIYTLSGALVRELRAGRAGESVKAAATTGTSQRLFLWDLRNANGRRVVPGIYLYYLSGGSSMIPERGKFAVLGKKRG